MEKDHYIICKERAREGSALFWKADGKGYTSDVEQAGLFTKEEAEHTEQMTHKDNIALNKDLLIKYFRVYNIANYTEASFDLWD